MNVKIKSVPFLITPCLIIFFRHSVAYITTSSLKTEAACSFKTLVFDHHTTWCSNPEYHTFCVTDWTVSLFYGYI